jgi:aryl-alcohol dehydrogenase-like predicted oxidoreductase
MNNKQTLVYGSAKFGDVNYGFSSNSYSKSIDFNQILDTLKNHRICSIDTSPRYGISEKIIGNYHKKNPKFKIFSKVDNLKPNDKYSKIKIEKSILESIKKLNVDFLDICFLHQNEIEIISDPYIQEGLNELRNKNLIKKIGVSIYNKHEFEYSLNSNIYESIQFPVNIFDTSLYNLYLNKYRDSNKELIARSIFLQGLGTSNINFDNHSFYESINTYRNKILDLTKKLDISIEALSIAYLKTLKHITKFIIGSLSIKNIENNRSYFDINLDQEIIDNINLISNTNKVWSNPKKWS